MTQLSYSFCMSMLHSLWQAGALLLCYMIVDKVFLQKDSPLVKRNFLFLLLGTQGTLFIITFFIYFFAGGNEAAAISFRNMLPGFLSNENVQLVTPWIFCAYVLIISYKLVKAVYTWYCFKQQYKQGLQRPEIDLKLFTESKAHQFGIKRKVKLWLSSTINTPVTFGFLKPVILLPVALLNNISAQQAETLILHELTHIRANDYLLNWFLLSAETIFFFNPFVALVCKKIRLEREQYCDISVIAFDYAPSLYAETLLQAERVKRLIPNFQLAAVSRKKQLLHRIHFFSTDKNFKQEKRISFIAPLVGLFLLVGSFSFMLLHSGGTAITYSITTTPPGFYPTSSAEINDAVIANTPLPEIKTPDLNAILAKVEKQRPVIEKQLKKLQPLIRSIEKNAEEFSDEVSKDFVTPIVEKENDAARQVIVKEESSGSRSASIKVYWLRFENGKWVLQPDWMATAMENTGDTLTKRLDSGRVKKLLPPQ